MRNLLAFLSAVTLTFFSLGWYLGWYKFHSSTATTGHRSVTIDINTVKISQDLERGEQKLHQLLENAGKEAPAKDKQDGSKDGNVTQKDTDGWMPEANFILPVKGEFDQLHGPRETRPTPEKKGKDSEGGTNPWFDLLPH
jgi:hypothetical protein